MVGPFAALLLLLGMLGAELALFGHRWAGLAAAALWLGCAAVLITTRPRSEPNAQPARTAPARIGAPARAR